MAMVRRAGRRQETVDHEDQEWAALSPDRRQEHLMAELIGEVVRIRQIVVAWWWLLWIGAAVVGLAVILG